MVSLTKPAEKKFDLDPDIAFPTDHMRRIIAAAREEKSILELPLYDGSDKGDKIFNTLTVIGRVIAPNERAPADAAAGISAERAQTLARHRELFRPQRQDWRSAASLCHQI